MWCFAFPAADNPNRILCVMGSPYRDPLTVDEVANRMVAAGAVFDTMGQAFPIHLSQIGDFGFGLKTPRS